MHKVILIPPPLIGLLLVGLAFAVDHWLPGLPHLKLPVLGAALIVAGSSLAGSALFGFHRRRTTFVPHGEPAALVTAGPYRWSRNPMYLGVAIVLAGFAFFLGTLPLFLTPIAFGLIIDRLFIPYEEAKLERLFGASYQDYRRQVRRWL